MIAENFIHDAMQFAIFMHGKQLYGNFPYIVHLCDVVKNLRVYNYDDPEMIAAGFLHDTIEDCQVTFEILDVRFSEKTANLVNAVSGNGPTRKARKESMIANLKAFPKAIPLKMADRLANIRNCAQFNPRLFTMYEKEFDDYDLMFEGADRSMNAEIRTILNK